MEAVEKMSSKKRYYKLSRNFRLKLKISRCGILIACSVFITAFFNLKFNAIIDNSSNKTFEDFYNLASRTRLKFFGFKMTKRTVFLKRSVFNSKSIECIVC